MTISSSQFETVTIDYLTKALPFSADVQEILNKLISKEMIEVIVGTGMKAMFRVTKILTPGAVGHTTDKLIRKGLIGVNLSDGPSGLRILRRSAVRGRNIKMVDYVFGFMNHFPKFVKGLLEYNPKRDQVIYQYATAFPVGTSLAQTWNVDLIERVGKAISGEMNEFEITYYLAPAMNIYRNPLCGRNFEYYSEDPFLSGKIGAAMTRGVQSNDGTYATIKHFACNNQEDNHNRSNSILSERALRELYLRGFEIAVKEAHPKAVMSSYNLINGVYTPNSYDLLTNILRKEWGFAGIVMTDQFSTRKGLAKNDSVIKSGNDMIMPGTNKAKRDICRALKKGTFSKTELSLACRNIINQIINSNVVRSG